MSILRPVSVAIFCMAAFMLFHKIATYPVEAVTRGRDYFEHYYYVIDSDGTAGISFFLTSLVLIPVWFIAWTFWAAVRITENKPWWMDVAIIFGTAAVFDLVLSSDWRGELPMMLPVLLVQSLFASCALTACFRFIIRWARLETAED